MFLAPAKTSSRAIAVPAAPAPLNTIFVVAKSFLTNFNALRRAANTTTAVPCWSS